MGDNDHLVVRPYDEEAPKKFEAAQDFLLGLMAFPIHVEHIGSSSVPGLGGKSVIDVMILCEKARMYEVVQAIVSAGYKFNPAEGFGTFPERYFISGWFPYRDGRFHVHYHITFPGSEEHRGKLLFRDYLRKHADVAQQYYDLKSKHCIIDGEHVTFLPLDKDPFVVDVVEKARQELQK